MAGKKAQNDRYSNNLTGSQVGRGKRRENGFESADSRSNARIGFADIKAGNLDARCSLDPRQQECRSLAQKGAATACCGAGSQDAVLIPKLKKKE
jgi:hypothetical protein